MEWTSIIDCAYDAEFTIADQSDETRLVTIQFKDFEGKNLDVPFSGIIYLSTDSAGLTFNALTDAELLEATYGKLQVLVTKLMYQLVTNAAGKIDVTVTENDTTSHYLVLVMPNGKLVVSDELTFI